MLPGIIPMAAFGGGVPQIAETPITILLTSGSSWTVPANWNSDIPGAAGYANRIECIGSGGDGESGHPGSTGGDGGGGGAYARIDNFAGSGSISYHVGVRSSSYSPNMHTWFNGTAYDNATCMAYRGYLNTGGPAANCTGTVKYSGGQPGTGSGSAGAGGGGGGKPTGNGNAASGTTGAADSAVLWIDNSGGPNNGLNAKAGGGGNGATSWTTTFNGKVYGGGGGGCAPDDGSHYMSKGQGVQGIIAITYYPYI